MSGAGVVVYYKGEIFKHKWCNTPKKAFNRFYKEGGYATDIINQDEDACFGDVKVLIVYSYHEYVNITKEATIS
jgi:hypothetical protein